jgi:hypothetical protein
MGSNCFVDQVLRFQHPGAPFASAHLRQFLCGAA